MRKISLSAIILMIIFSLSACNVKDSNPKIDTVSAATLTEREQAILTTTTDQSFIFDFKTDDAYKEVSVWVEKYESGNLIGEINRISTEIQKEGTIIFTTSKTNEERNQAIFSISITSDGSSGTGWGPVTLSKDLSGVVQGSNPVENIPITDQMVLGSICYTANATGMSSLSSDFYADAENHMSELSNYDVVYLLRSEFIQ